MAQKSILRLTNEIVFVGVFDMMLTTRPAGKRHWYMEHWHIMEGHMTFHRPSTICHPSTWKRHGLSLVIFNHFAIRRYRMTRNSACLSFASSLSLSYISGKIFCKIRWLPCNEGNSYFCFPRISGGKINCLLREQSLSDLLKGRKFWSSNVKRSYSPFQTVRHFIQIATKAYGNRALLPSDAIDFCNGVFCNVARSDILAGNSFNVRCHVTAKSKKQMHSFHILLFPHFGWNTNNLLYHNLVLLFTTCLLG